MKKHQNRNQIISASYVRNKQSPRTRLTQQMPPCHHQAEALTRRTRTSGRQRRHKHKNNKQAGKQMIPSKQTSKSKSNQHANRTCRQTTSQGFKLFLFELPAPGSNRTLRRYATSTDNSTNEKKLYMYVYIYIYMCVCVWLMGGVP